MSAAPACELALVAHFHSLRSFKKLGKAKVEEVRLFAMQLTSSACSLIMHGEVTCLGNHPPVELARTSGSDVGHDAFHILVFRDGEPFEWLGRST
jgi:hypothetical protein